MEVGDIVQIVNKSSKWYGYVGVVQCICRFPGREMVYKIEMPGKAVLPFLTVELKKLARQRI